MNVLIVGYGQMGKEVEKFLKQRNHSIVKRIDSNGSGDSDKLTLEALQQSDVVIEFAHGQGVLENTKLYTQAKVPVVMATTGWDAVKDEVKALVLSSGIGFVYGSNFSIGAHLFFKMIGEAAKLIEPFAEYDIMVHEYHHKLKKDSPSGTALTTAKIILESNARKKTICKETLDRPIRPEELHVSSTRGGSIPGVHIVTIDSDADSIKIEHNARNRTGFALGAVIAGEWIRKQKGFIPAENLFKEILNQRSQ